MLRMTSKCNWVELAYFHVHGRKLTHSFTIFNCSMGSHFWNATHTKPSVTRHILLCISWKPPNYDSCVTILRQISVYIIGFQAHKSPNFLLVIYNLRTTQHRVESRTDIVAETIVDTQSERNFPLFCCQPSLIRKLDRVESRLVLRWATHSSLCM